MATLTLKGKSFKYHVEDIHLQVTFQEENQLHWEYLAAPDGMTGKNATETITVIPIRDDIALLAWKEADGTQVLDVYDIGEMVVHSNNVGPDGERSSATTNLEAG